MRVASKLEREVATRIGSEAGVLSCLKGLLKRHTADTWLHGCTVQFSLTDGMPIKQVTAKLRAPPRAPAERRRQLACRACATRKPSRSSHGGPARKPSAPHDALRPPAARDYALAVARSWTTWRAHLRESGSRSRTSHRFMRTSIGLLRAKLMVVRRTPSSAALEALSTPAAAPMRARHLPRRATSARLILILVARRHFAMAAAAPTGPERAARPRLVRPVSAGRLRAS